MQVYTGAQVTFTGFEFDIVQSEKHQSSSYEYILVEAKR